MSVKINKNDTLITIHTKNTTYQMMVSKLGHLLHLYYGKKTEGDMSYLLTYYDRGFSGNPYDAGTDRTYSMDVLLQEYPSYGTGDYRTTALRVRNADGSYSCDLRVVGVNIKKGKYALPNLPTVHTDQEADTLELLLKDKVSGLLVTLLYGVIEDLDVITRAVRIQNDSGNEIAIEKASSMSLDYLSGRFDLIHFHGRHGMERQMERSALGHSCMTFGSRRGTSSHQQNPFFMLAGNDTTEQYGDVYGFSLLYSGNFKAEVELDQYRQSRVVFGLSDECFSWNLKPGEEFVTPEVAMSYSHQGFEKISENYHKLIRYHVIRGAYQTKRRPVLLNNWEATYFDFTGEKIIAIAKEAAKLGVEMLVLDDGWFGKRDSDFSGLGDWVVNEDKLGGTLKHVVEQVNALGMKFGLWIEPEMVSEDSELYRKHPDWAFQIPGRMPVRSRHQLVLDFSRKEVVDGIFEQIAGIIESTNIAYIKMDMNRHLSDVFSATNECQNQGAILYRYVLGVYDFMERMTTRFPDLLIEGCSGGGGRFDAGMLYYTPQIWCSDNTDAIDRIKIQYGTSFGYPISTVGSHVSAVPNHQTGRTTDITTRAVVAMAGSFGYELDLNLISDEEKELVKKQIDDYKRYFDLIHNGTYYRLSNPFENSEFAAWEFVSKDQKEVLLNIVTLNSPCNPAQEYVFLRGLKEQAVYQMEGAKEAYTGGALMYGGLPIPRMSGEYQAWQVHLIEQE